MICREKASMVAAEVRMELVGLEQLIAKATYSAPHVFAEFMLKPFVTTRKEL